MPVPVADLQQPAPSAIIELFEIELFTRDGDEVWSQIDGEEWEPGHTFAIQVLPRSLPLIVRRDWIPPWPSSP